MAGLPVWLSGERPTDLHIGFEIDGQGLTVLEGDYVFQPPWHVYVERVYRPGLPSDPSRLAVVWTDPAIAKEMVIHSTRRIAEGRINFLDTPTLQHPHSD